MRPFMPRDNDKDNASRGRRDRPSGGKGRSGHARGPEKKFAKRGFVGKGDGDKRSYAGERDDAKPSYGKKPYSGSGKPYAGKREGAPPRRDRDEARAAAGFSENKFGDKRPYTPRGEGFRKGGDRPQRDRPYGDRPPRDGDRPRRDRPEGKFGGDKKFSRGAPDRGPRKDFGTRPDRGHDRGDAKPWQKHDARSPDRAGRKSHSSPEGAIRFDKRGYDKPRYDKARQDRGGDDRPRFSRSREDRPQDDRFKGDRREPPKFERPRQSRNDWQEHPRSDARDDRPRRENEDDSKIFAKRPAFGGRGAYRERKGEFEKRAPQPPRVKKSGERIAKALARAGLA